MPKSNQKYPKVPKFNQKYPKEESNQKYHKSIQKFPQKYLKSVQKYP